MRHGQHNVAGAVLRRQMLGPRPQSFGSDNYWADYRVTHRSVGTSGVLAFNWKAEHGTLLAVGSRDAYALNIVSLERAPASSTVWTTWTPWRRDADAAPLRSVCEPHVLAVEANAHSNWINDIVFSHDDLDLLSASEDGSVVMYDVQRGKKRTVHEIPSAQAARSVSTAASDRDAVFIAANNVVYVWDRRTKSSGQSLVGHSARVSDVQSTEDGGTLWSTSLDGTLKCWDRRKNACLTSLGSRATPLASVCLDRTETRLLVSSERGPVFLFDLLATPALQGPALASVPAAKAFTGHSNRHYLKRARFSPCGNYIMCGSDDKRAYVWNVSSGKAHVFELPDVRLASLVDASFSHGPQQPLVGVASEEGLFVWSPAAVPVPSPPVTDSAPAPPTHVPYEIKFSVEGTPVDDDFVEVNDDEDDEEEEEELEEELGDLVREPGVCSYDKGYATTHVFVCRTCSLSSDPHTSAGMCFECRVTCHADHDTVSIGKKKNFRCDCGTDKYPNVPCLLRAGKEPNDRNVYTHNFELLYCFCNQPDNGELMILCIECLEWFHHTCLEIPNQEAITEGLDFICTSCITAHYPFLTQYRTANLASRSAAVPPPSGVLGYGVTGGRFMLPEWRESRVLRPEHARLASAAAASATQQASAPPAATNGTAAHNTPLPPAPAPVTAPPPAAPAAPLFEPRTKEELDAEARRLIQMGDREGARNLVMRAMLSNTLNLLSSSRRRTVTVQDVARAAQDMQAAPATTTIATGASLASLELEAQPPPQPQVPPPPVAASAPVHTATPPAAPNEAPPHGAKHARAEEPPPAASLSAPAAPERPAKAARPDDAHAPLASPAAPPAPPSPAPLRTSAKGVEVSPSPAPLRSSASAASAAPTPALAPAPVPAPVPAAAPPQAPPAASPAALSTSSKSIESLRSALGASALPLTDSGASATAVVTVPDDMDAAPEDAAPGEALPPAPEAMDSEPEPVSQPPPPPPRAAPPAAEPELVMGDAPALAEEPEVAMSDAAPIPAAAASTAASGAVSGSADAVEAIVDANEALADDMERRLAELVDNGA